MKVILSNDTIKNPSIKLGKNGPLVLSGLDILEQDNSLKVDTKRTIALCRCGNSKTKPYCDGTHGKTDFSDINEKQDVEGVINSYAGKLITINHDAKICAHIGYCTTELPKVFWHNKKQTIDPDAASFEDLIAICKKCPSGALTYTIENVLYDNHSDTPNVRVIKDGPYFFSGNIEIDIEQPPTAKEHFALCRCGKSKNKPYCDGTHWYKEFKDEGLIPEVPELEKKLVENKMDEKIHNVNHLASTGKSENSAMATLLKFPTFNEILFNGSQLKTMPINDDVDVSLKTIIGKNAKKPLELELPFYVSHMSFGALSREAKIALAAGTSLVGTAMCSGEGGMLPEARKAAKKYIYELGTAAFSHIDSVIKQADAVEIKIGQGVKPGLGGHLPANKITPEIAKIRGLKPGEDSVSPGRLVGLNVIEDLEKLVTRLRVLTDGVPIGVKFASGNIEADLEEALKSKPDFITIDCRGGATGSSPKFLKDNIGTPPVYAIRRARRYLDSVNSDVTLCITGGFRDSSDIAKGLALGADAIALATSSLIAIGCIQAKICHTGSCPAGITTQDENLRQLFDSKTGVKRFENFYMGTAKELKVFARSHGLDNIHNLDVHHVSTISGEVAKYTDIKHV